MAYKKKLKIIKKRLLKKENEKRSIKRYFDVPPLEDSYMNGLDNCLCTDRKHQFKDIYESEHEAESQAKYLHDIFGLNISIYPCPYSTGWHLTQR